MRIISAIIPLTVWHPECWALPERDNQGIVGLEVKYEEYLEGEPGTILTVTDARGIEVDEEGESRLEPVDGDDLYISMDLNIQQYASPACGAGDGSEGGGERFHPGDEAGQRGDSGDGERAGIQSERTVYPAGGHGYGRTCPEEEKQDLLNQMWRNRCISDTYEPGSVFKTITAAAALEEGVVTMEDTFNCPGYVMVEDRRIRCHKITGHGTQTFVEATMNSCNPVFVTVGLRLGAENYYRYFEQFNLLEKTGVDLPGEAGTIMHKLEDIGAVELATISFGQSFQVTPIRLAATISSLINGGNAVTPHFGVKTVDAQGNVTNRSNIRSRTAWYLRILWKSCVICWSRWWKTAADTTAMWRATGWAARRRPARPFPEERAATSLPLWASLRQTIPKVLAMAIITNPQGTYYGGQVCCPGGAPAL